MHTRKKVSLPKEFTSISMIQAKELLAKRNEVYLATISIKEGEVDGELDIIPVVAEYKDVFESLKKIHHQQREMLPPLR